MKKADILSQAKEYVRRGFSAIPLKARSKIPAIPWRAYQERLPTEEELYAWFGNGSQYNIAIVTGPVSGLVVLDADSAEAVEWCEKSLPITPTVQTARGRHYCFKFRPGLKNSVKVNGLNLDVRGKADMQRPIPQSTSSGPFINGSKAVVLMTSPWLNSRPS